MSNFAGIVAAPPNQQQQQQQQPLVIHAAGAAAAAAPVNSSNNNNGAVANPNVVGVVLPPTFSNNGNRAVEFKSSSTPQTNKKAARLPKGWKAHTTSTGKPFWFQHVLGVTSWTFPE
jgi:hypothetical protein